MGNITDAELNKYGHLKEMVNGVELKFSENLIVLNSSILLFFTMTKIFFILPSF